MEHTLSQFHPISHDSLLFKDLFSSALKMEALLSSETLIPAYETVKRFLILLDLYSGGVRFDSQRGSRSS
jgi:hypothetical protein